MPGTQQDQTGYPKICRVGQLESGTHALCGVALEGYKDSEASLAQQAIHNLKPDILYLADRGFSGYPLWQTAGQMDAHLLTLAYSQEQKTAHNYNYSGSRIACN